MHLSGVTLVSCPGIPKNPSKNSITCGQVKGDEDPEDTIICPSSLPREFSVFRVSSYDGSLSPDKSKCKAAGLAAEKIESTISKLNLNSPALRITGRWLLGAFIKRLLGEE